MPTTTEPKTLSHLKQLEAESIFIIREVAAEFKNPVMLYSVGKDSSVMVRLAQKAFHPGKIPFPLLHVDTGYKFPEMYEFRDKFIQDIGAQAIGAERNEEAIAGGSQPLPNTGSRNALWSFFKTQGLLDALTEVRFLMRLLVGQEGKRKSPAPRKGSIPSVIPSANGTPRTRGLSYGTSITRRSTKGNRSGCSRFPIGPNWIFGFTSRWKRFP